MIDVSAAKASLSDAEGAETAITNGEAGGMLSYQGPIDAAARFCREPIWQSPNLWWPEDRSWYVATEIDLHCSYVGGSQSLVDVLHRDERLETLPSALTDAL